jgi:hypothetical protein
MKKLILLILFLCVAVGAQAAEMQAPAPPGSGTFAELGGDNEFTGTNIFETGIAFGNMSTPPPLGTQYTLFVYGGEWYWRTTDANLAVGWATAFSDSDISFLQVSTYGADFEDLQDGGDAAFDTYWSAASPLTVDRVNNKFVMSAPVLTAVNNTLLFVNDKPGYIFDVTKTPITVTIPVNFPAIGAELANEYAIIQGEGAGQVQLGFKITRDSNGMVEKMETLVFKQTTIDFSTHIIVDLPDTFNFGNEVVFAFIVDGTKWILYADGVSIASDEDVPDFSSSGSPNMEMPFPIESWTDTMAGAFLTITDTAAIASQVILGDITVTETAP